MLRCDQNGPIMPSHKSNIVKNDIFLSKLEKELIFLSKKYGLGEVLFMEKNPLNIDSFHSFYISAPEDWSNKKIFAVWDKVTLEAIGFAKKEGVETLSEICGIIVSNRY